MKEKSTVFKILLSYFITLVSINSVLAFLYYVNNSFSVQYKYASSFFGFYSVFVLIVLLPSTIILVGAKLIYFFPVIQAKSNAKTMLMSKINSLSVFLFASHALTFLFTYVAFGIRLNGSSPGTSINTITIVFIGFVSSGFYSFIQSSVNSIILKKSGILKNVGFSGKKSRFSFGLTTRTNLILIMCVLFSLVFVLENNFQVKKENRILAYTHEQIENNSITPGQAVTLRNEYLAVNAFPDKGVGKNNEGMILAITILTIFIITGLSLVNIVPHTKEVNSRIKRQQQKILKMLKGDMDISRENSAFSNDELEHLSESINLLLEKFAEILITVHQNTDSAHTVSGSLDKSLNSATVAIEEMIATITQITGNTTSQMSMMEKIRGELEEMLIGIEGATMDVDELSTFVQETSSAMHETTTSINTISKNTEQVNNLSSQLIEVANDGRESVRNTVDAIKEIEQASGQITDIIGIISDIAAQTNLLAMNASIEAAHAGEKGRGFAVVADEIRKLAEQSNQNIFSIGEQIKDMVEKVKTGVEMSMTADNAFGKIDGNINLTTQHIRQVTDALHEQNQGVGDIMSALESMVNKTIEIKEISDDLKTKSETMHKSMENLYEISLEINSATDEQDKGNKEIIAMISTVKEASRKNLSVADSLYNILNEFNLVEKSAR